MEIPRRQFLRSSLVLGWPPSLPAINGESEKPSSIGGPSYDPLLDRRCRRLQPAAEDSRWQATWISHPGQLAAHALATRMQASMRRCVNIGYPRRIRCGNVLEVPASRVRSG